MGFFDDWDPSQLEGWGQQDNTFDPSQLDGWMPQDDTWDPSQLPGWGAQDPIASADSSVAGGGNSAGSIIQKLLGKSSNGANQADLASILGAFSQGQKANRVVQGNFTQDYDKTMLGAQAARNANESDALKKLAQTSYIMGGGSQFKPPTLAINGKTYNTPDLGFGPKASSDAQKAGASTLQAQLQARLMPGGSYTPQPLDSYAKPGTAENIGSYGAVGTGILGGITNALSGGNSNPMRQPIPGRVGAFATSNDGGKTWTEE